ncbi:GPP34 family phosphoprotein [Saccharopolyspora hirsuta]|uniref:GOLPH3/VPS74 family protein n=1 Tax=Saccharopolyspora hirsuta TaxID=1837 RepID=UPI001478C8FC|nr:GPP34 family phosphoprotein [Saccharopolyspora hirsuta]
MILSDELALIGHTPEGARYGGAPRVAIAAGEVGELLLQQRLVPDGRFLLVRDPTPTGHPVPDQVLGQLVHRRSPMRLGTLLVDRANCYPAKMNHLVSTGLVRAEARGSVFARHRYVPEPNLRNAVLLRLQNMLTGAAAPDPRTVALAGIVHGAALGTELIPFADHRAALAHFGEREPLGRAVQEVLARSNTAAVAATVIVTSS